MTTYIAVFQTRATVVTVRCASLEEAQQVIESVVQPSSFGQVIEQSDDGEQRTWRRVDSFWTHKKGA